MNRAFIAALALVAACGRAQPDPGTERGACKDDHTCSSGLVCLSDLCVRPPAGDCGKVAEALATVKLGGNADAAKRAPEVAALRAQCETAELSIDDATCLTSAKGKVAMSKCPHPLLPELVELAADKTGCKAVGARMEELARAGLDKTPDDLMSKLLPKMIAAVTSSCTDDGWNDAAKSCMSSASDDDPDAVQTCMDKLPPDVQAKFMARIRSIAADVPDLGPPQQPPPDDLPPDLPPAAAPPAPAPPPSADPALPAQVPDDDRPPGMKPKQPAK